MISVMLPVYIAEPWQLPMARAAAETVRMTAGEAVELVIVETCSRHMADLADVYVHRAERTSPNADHNAGLDACSGEFVVCTQTDIFTRPGWLNALRRCFEIEDCGAATLASSDLVRGTGPYLSEGLYGPFMMIPAGWRYDAETFPQSFGDTDLMMRVYRSGKRMYRNHGSMVFHMTHTTIGAWGDFREARERFRTKHADIDNGIRFERPPVLTYGSRNGASPPHQIVVAMDGRAMPPAELVFRALSDGWIL